MRSPRNPASAAAKAQMRSRSGRRLPIGYRPPNKFGIRQTRALYNKKTVPKYSIVVPLHNEQENVTDLYDRLKAVMEAAAETFELVLVDDGSSDHTFAMLREIAAVDSRVTVVKLRRNFGQTAGLAAGFDHARRAYI